GRCGAQRDQRQRRIRGHALEQRGAAGRVIHRFPSRRRRTVDPRAPWIYPGMRFVLLGLLCSVLALAHGADLESSVTVSGDIQRPVTISVDTLRNFAASGQVNFKTSRDTDGRQQQTVVRGVSLKAVLEQSGLAERDRFDWRKAVVIAIARDGYRAVFSWPELFNTEGGAQVMLAYERDGGPLGTNEGPIALHAPGDTRTGPRHVKWLERIEVRVLRD